MKIQAISLARKIEALHNKNTRGASRVNLGGGARIPGHVIFFDVLSFRSDIINLKHNLHDCRVGVAVT